MTHNLQAYEMSMDYDYFDVRLWMGTALALLAEAEARRTEANQDEVVKVMLMLHTNIADSLVPVERWREAADHYHQAASMVVGKRAGCRAEGESVLSESTPGAKSASIGTQEPGSR
ncbi:hypothetical protein ABZX92_39685 [Lentzea sp. NPDC006480]|uniref:hypothetical protein n=1 Tax=Lentzea sp. NPDC006480 TaxID=3157176 RepID=UPI0033BD7CE9